MTSPFLIVFLTFYHVLGELAIIVFLRFFNTARQSSQNVNIQNSKMHKSLCADVNKK